MLLDPNLITLLFLGGILGIAFELTHPGIVLPGLLGTVSLLLALLGLSIVPFSWAGVALLGFGIALLALEAHVPAHGAFASVGAGSLFLGGVVLFRVDNSPYGTTSFWLVLAITVSLGLITTFFIARIWQARRLPPRGGGVTLVGQLATVATLSTPKDRCSCPGNAGGALLAGGGAHPGERVRITAQRGLVLDVEREPADPRVQTLRCPHEHPAGTRRRRHPPGRPAPGHGGARPPRVRARRRSSGSAVCSRGRKARA